ncbi:photosystem II assembly protein Psb34 [Synechocystis sp. PCC 7338]|uniref:photosystem II assembly protein Psb34 n=1 Tax=Synechocystis sp. PCC 7338 TaxID=2732530 RepID=UPI001BB0328A|nr:ssl1498 family light-harvesting-like protein [Synechocystis sp. PCC 7338]QUS60855.1 ssl1498 family light-harvesting-like protein [Synechocystis sp. PCC 7338]
MNKYIKDDDGRLNNFAVEPRIYTADAPSKADKRNYLIMAAITVVLVTGLIAVAVAASGTST